LGVVSFSAKILAAGKILNERHFSMSQPAHVLAFTTENKNKLAEATRYARSIPKAGLRIVSLPVSVDETADTFQGNADLKALAAVEKLLGDPHLMIGGMRPTAIIGEDSGLIIEELSGKEVYGVKLPPAFPGIQSNRWLDVYGLRPMIGLEELPPGQKSSDADRNLAILKLMEGHENRNAKYVSAISYIDLKNPSEIRHFIGEMPLRVIPSDQKPRGLNGFAYDSIMEVAAPQWPMLLGKTVGELTPVNKDAISHRGRALKFMFEAILQV
jgi:XTP/dITP diphosphohydrolase